MGHMYIFKHQSKFGTYISTTFDIPTFLFTVLQHFFSHFAVLFITEGVGALVAQVPEVLLCKPSNLDRWDRRLVELAAFWSIHGHCDVPEVPVVNTCAAGASCSTAAAQQRHHGKLPCQHEYRSCCMLHSTHATDCRV